MKSELVLLKLGGSVITNKDVPMSLRGEVVVRLLQEIKQAMAESNCQVLIAHGQGSFAHQPATRYQTMAGFINDESRYGMTVTQDCAAQLNRIIVKAGLDLKLPAVSFLMSNALVANNNRARAWNGQVLLEYLKAGLLPISCGDVLVDSKKGCTIWSAEKVLSFLLGFVQDAGYTVKKVIHVTEVDGVLDDKQNVIPKISSKNQAKVKGFITATKGADVTGGMWHKIQESLEMAENQSVESRIIAGLKPGNLYNCLLDQPFVGTVVAAQ